jgi:hypothetical protein
MERSEMREELGRAANAPDFASLHQGYENQ